MLPFFDGLLLIAKGKYKVNSVLGNTLVVARQLQIWYLDRSTTTLASQHIFLLINKYLTCCKDLCTKVECCRDKFLKGFKCLIELVKPDQKQKHCFHCLINECIMNIIKNQSHVRQCYPCTSSNHK